MKDNWITTKKGDSGETSLCNGQRVPKDSPRVELYGTLDECQAHLGMARATCDLSEICKNICVLEQDLGPVMGYIALCPELEAPQVEKLENIIEKVRVRTGETFRFIRPGDSVPGAALHAARTVARRAERLAVSLYRKKEIDTETYRYINRLSDAIYAISLWTDHLFRAGEETNCK